MLIKYGAGDITLSEARASLGIIESFLVRRFLAGEKANLLSRIFTDLINQFPAEGRYPSRLRRALSTPGHAWPMDGEVETSVTRVLNFYSQGSASQKRFILKQLNVHKLQNGTLKKEQIDLSWPEDLTIEHIMPVRLNAAWRRVLEAERNRKGYNRSVDELHHEYVNQLGNLTLVPQARNSQYSNKAFADKILLINRELPIRLNRELGKGPYREWGFERIRLRSRSLAKLANAIWAGPARSASGSAG